MLTPTEHTVRAPGGGAGGKILAGEGWEAPKSIREAKEALVVTAFLFQIDRHNCKASAMKKEEGLESFGEKTLMRIARAFIF